MTPFMAGFTDELVKTAGRVGEMVERLKKSPQLRSAVRRGALMYGTTGALAGLADSDDKHGKLYKVLRDAGVGAVGGAVQGYMLPSWYEHHGSIASDEKKGGHLASKLKKVVPAAVGALGSVVGVGSVGDLAGKALGH